MSFLGTTIVFNEQKMVISSKNTQLTLSRLECDTSQIIESKSHTYILSKKRLASSQKNESILF